MATEQNFTIRKGRTGNVVVTVSDITNWTGLLAKLYIYDEIEQSSVVLTLTGTIDAPNNKVTFPYTHTDTDDLEGGKSYYYDVTIYNATNTYVKDSNYGLIYVAPVAQVSPN